LIKRVHAFSKACLRSYMISSKSSMPHEILIKLSAMPNSFLYSGGTDMCVMRAGFSMRLSTPPKLSARVNILTAFRKFSAVLMSPLM